MGTCRVFAILLTWVAAEYDNFPVKSVNLNVADQIGYYKIPGTEPDIEDAHPVYGIETSDKGFIFVGKAIGSGDTVDAFAIKIDANGDKVWLWKSNVAGNDVANAVVELPDGKTVLVAGYRTANSIAKRALTQLSLSSGTEAWTTVNWGDTAGKHGAFESAEIAAAPDNGILLSGFEKKPTTDEMSFKSYGSVAAGEAFVMKLPLSAVSSSTAPTGDDAAWYKPQGSAFFTCKSVRPLANGDIIALFYKEAAGARASLTLYKADGTVKWGPTDYTTQHGLYANDVAVASDGSGFAITGHGDGGVSGAFYGRLTKVNMNGDWQWSKSYGVMGSGVDKLIKNECWGITATPDGGWVMACGTGIENCNGVPSSMAADCAANKPLLLDTRTGAVGRSAAVWQSLVVRTDAAGSLLWQRVDQHRASDAAALGTSGWEQSSSASEYVQPTSDGGYVFIQDEAMGAGILKLQPQTTTTTTLAPAPASTTTAKPTLAPAPASTTTTTKPSSAPVPAPGPPSPSKSGETTSLASAELPSLFLSVAFALLYFF